MMTYKWNQIVFFLVFVSLAACSTSAYQWNGSPYQNPQPAAEVNLFDTKGEEFKLSEHGGKAVLLFFGYTFCPDVCPTTVADMRQVFDQLGEDAERVIFCFITVDPERDTPQILESYLRKHNASFYGLWGDPETLDEIKTAYGVYAEKDSQDSENYLITHTARVFLIDAEGVLRTNYSFGTYPEEILADVRHILGIE